MDFIYMRSTSGGVGEQPIVSGGLRGRRQRTYAQLTHIEAKQIQCRLGRRRESDRRSADKDGTARADSRTPESGSRVREGGSMIRDADPR